MSQNIFKLRQLKQAQENKFEYISIYERITFSIFTYLPEKIICKSLRFRAT